MRPNEQSMENSQTVSDRRGAYIGLAAAAGWALYLPAQAYSAILMPTALAVLGFWFVVWWILRRRHLPSPLGIFLLGLLIGFIAMGVATVLFLLPLVVAAVFLRNESRSTLLRRFGLTGSLAIGLALGIAPCWTHNYFIARDPVLLSAHSGVNFWIGNNPLATGYPRMPPGLHAGQEAMLQDSITVAQGESARELKRSEVSDYWSAKARAYIRENPGDWLKLIARKIDNFWNAFQYDDLSIITNLRLEGILFPGLRFGLVAALALAGVFFAFSKAPRSRWILAAILLHMASLLSVFVTERYRLAAVPGLLLFASFGLFEFWHSIVRAKYAPAAAYATLLVLAALFVSNPRTDRSLWALDPYNSGWQALQSRNFALAKAKLELAYAYVPENAEVNFALGNLRLEQNDKTGAKSYYASTLKLDLTHEGAWNNLGVLALEEERWELAEKFFHGALRASPNDPKTHFLLARALFGQGEMKQARSEVEIALQANPGQAEFRELADKIPQSE